MLRSLMTAVTGVRAHQTMLDVTGNNIANANTTGFKKDNTIFQDLMYQNQKLASAPADGRGGINPAQIGLGVSVGAIETIYTQGAANFTGNPSDMMIQGNGFFIYSNGTGDNLYSRAGACVRDANNELVQSGTGYKVQGYAMEEDPLNKGSYVKSSDLSNITIPLGKKLEPKATSEVKYQCNLDSRSDAYLPYGFSDLPYNSVCGWPGNPAGTARMDLVGGTYDISFKSDLSATADTTSHNIKDYVSVELKLGNEHQVLGFDITGIGSDGKPILSLARSGFGNTSATLTFTDITSNTGTVDLSTQADGSTKNRAVVTYNDETGILRVQSVGEDSYMEYNLKSSMRYESITLNDGTSEGIPVLLEFDERAMSGGSDLSDRTARVTMWFYDKNNSTKTMGKMVADVTFNAAGYFESVTPINDASLKDSEGNALTGLTFPQKKGGTAAMTANDLQIAVTNSGSSLALQIKEGSSWKTMGQTTQGGFHQTKQTIYDCKGNPYTLEVNFKKLTENRWRWEAFLLDSEGKQVTGPTCEDGTTVATSSNIIPYPSSGEVAFCGCGPICDPLEQEISIPFSLLGMPNQTLTLNFGGDGDKLYGVTQFASETTTKAVYQDGYKMGILEDYSIGVDGTITGNYSNGQRIPLYRVAIATFANEQGLEKVGNTMFRATINSGNANIDPAGVNGKGSIMAQNTEMSNVDLTEEFTHLIIAQRGFQANTRVITTSDQILEEVVNLKR